MQSGRAVRCRHSGHRHDHGNATSRLMLNLLGAFADFEQSLISERTRAGLARARREGRVGGRPRVVVDPAHQAAGRRRLHGAGDR